MKFENLIVWQKSLELTHQIHLLTRNFPKEEMYILTTQIKRASDSICLNIAEGSTGNTDKEFNRFLGISLRSAMEVIACLHIAIKRDLISEKEFLNLRSQTEEIIKMLQAFRKKLKAKD